MISRISSSGCRSITGAKLHHALTVIIGEPMNRGIPRILNAESSGPADSGKQRPTMMIIVPDI